MGPFGILDPAAETHLPGTPCAGCTVEGYPRPCPRVVARTVAPIFDAEGQGRTVGHRWVERTCGDEGGHVHAERLYGALETRCDRCGIGA